MRIEIDASSAAGLIAPLCMTALIAFVTWLTRRPSAFWCGMLCCWGAWMIPSPRVHVSYRSAEGAYMGTVRENWDRAWDMTPTAAIVGTVAGLVCSEVLWRHGGN